MTKAVSIGLLVLLAVAFIAPLITTESGPRVVVIVRESENDTPELDNLQHKARQLVEAEGWRFERVDQDMLDNADHDELLGMYATMGIESGLPAMVVGNDEGPRWAGALPSTPQAIHEAAGAH